MKRLLLFFLSLVFLLSFPACAGTGRTDEPVPTPAESPAATDTDGVPATDAVMTGKIMRISGTSLLMAGAETAQLYTVSTDLSVFDACGALSDVSALAPGQAVEIGYAGGIMESYPMQLGSPVYIRITGVGDDLVGFYLGVLEDLWAVDTGLNGGISVLAFDLSEVTNLTNGEKSALVYLMSGAHGLQGITGTFDELSEQGYIDLENLYFETGLLFEFKLSDVTGDAFTFSVSKWRSGLGAYFFTDCRAVRGDSGWSYTVGAEAIS